MYPNLKKRIDQIVYLLYGLDADEIDIVEGAAKCLNRGLNGLSG